MNIRCSFCQTPYTLSRVAMLDALQEVDSKKLNHYDAHCPRCRRATRIPRQRLEMAMPNWREELKQFEKEMKEHPQQEAPLPEAASSPVAQAEAAPEPAPAKKGASKAKPEATPAESKPKTAPRQTTPSAETKKSTDRKTSTKGTSKKSK
jgi:nucleoid-associated protein YgaU